jgi:hypothetical protein
MAIKTTEAVTMIQICSAVITAYTVQEKCCIHRRLRQIVCLSTDYVKGTFCAAHRFVTQCSKSAVNLNNEFSTYCCIS